jgi:HSP20 family protein
MLSPLFDFNERFKLFDNLERQVDQMFTGQARGDATRMILRDNGDELLLVADLPGVSEKDLEISLEGDVLTIHLQGDRQTPSGYKLVRSERPSMRMVRQIELPVRVDVDDLQATLRDGVLELRLPKAKEARPRKIPVHGAQAAAQSKSQAS